MADTWNTTKIKDNYAAVTQNRIDLSAVDYRLREAVKNIKSPTQMLQNLPLEEVDKAFKKTEAQLSKALDGAKDAISEPTKDQFSKIDSKMTEAAKALSEKDTSAELGNLSKAVEANVDQLGKAVPKNLADITKSFGEISANFGDLTQLKGLTGEISNIAKTLKLPDTVLNVDELIKIAGTPEFDAKIAQLKLIPYIDLKEIDKLEDLGKKLGGLNLQGVLGGVKDLNPETLMKNTLDGIKNTLGSVTKEIGKLDVASLSGALIPQLNGLQANLQGLIDGDKLKFADMSINLELKLNNLVTGVAELDIKDLNEAAKMLEASGTDLNTLIGELEKQGHIIRGRTVTGLRTVPSAIQSTRTTPGVRSTGSRASTSSSNNSGGTPSTSLSSGGQPGRLEGTRVSFANSDPRQVPRQEIVDALDAMCKELDIYVQITPQGGWTYRKTGTPNHPNGWAADFQILADKGGLLVPKTSQDLYGKCGQFLRDWAKKGKGVTPGIGCYPNFMHYDEYPPRSDYGRNLNYITWGSGWPLKNYLGKQQA